MTDLAKLYCRLRPLDINAFLILTLCLALDFNRMDIQTACKIQARDLVRTRRHVQKFYQMRAQLQAVSLRIQTLRSNQQMAEAMKGATRVSAKNNVVDR